MATRFMSKALLTAALGIALSLLLAATTTTSSAASNMSLQLDLPAAPSHCMARTFRYDDGDWSYALTYAMWTDNSSNEDGFTVEEWRKNQGGDWVLMWSFDTPANATAFEVFGRGQNYRYRVKAFNAAGESDWSNWARNP